MTKTIPDVKQIFEDLDSYRDFCRYEGKVFDEAELYNDGSRNWEDYKRYRHYINTKNSPKRQKRN